MRTEQFENIINNRIETCKSVLCSKAEEYATDDRLHNFKAAGELQKCTPVKALGGMMAKHTVSVYDLIEDYEQGKEISPKIWAEAKVRYTQNEPLYLSKETEQLAKQVQSDHREVSVKEGLIRDFLDKRVPRDWNCWDLAKRRDFWSEIISVPEDELVERDRVCALEIWCELFNGDFRQIQRRDSIEINSIISSFDDWEKYGKVIKFNKDYGVQKGFKRA